MTHPPASTTGNPAIFATSAVFIDVAAVPAAEKADTRPGLTVAAVSDTMITAPLALFMARKVLDDTVPRRTPRNDPAVAPATATTPVATELAVPETISAPP
ncbi:hypothetical protein NBRC116586_09210 [Pseudooceanicola nitratireducens]